jgi:hypothetical protein
MSRQADTPACRDFLFPAALAGPLKIPENGTQTSTVFCIDLFYENRQTVQKF